MSTIFFGKDSTFLDYVRGGLKVNMVCALDMSKSSASLHRLSDILTKIDNVRFGHKPFNPQAPKRRERIYNGNSDGG